MYRAIAHPDPWSLRKQVFQFLKEATFSQPVKAMPVRKFMELFAFYFGAFFLLLVVNVVMAAMGSTLTVATLLALSPGVEAPSPSLWVERQGEFCVLLVIAAVAFLLIISSPNKNEALLASADEEADEELFQNYLQETVFEQT